MGPTLQSLTAKLSLELATKTILWLGLTTTCRTVWYDRVAASRRLRANFNSFQVPTSDEFSESGQHSLLQSTKHQLLHFTRSMNMEINGAGDGNQIKHHFTSVHSGEGVISVLPNQTPKGPGGQLTEGPHLGL